MTATVDAILKPNVFLHLDTFPQGEDYNLDLFKLDVLAKKLSKSMIREFKWTEEIEDSFQACNAVIFDDFDSSTLSTSDIQSVIFQNTMHLPNSHLSFVVISLNLFHRKNEKAIISSYIDELLENYTTYTKIFKFAIDKFKHEISKKD
jgi:hypothetical protein